MVFASITRRSGVHKTGISRIQYMLDRRELMVFASMARRSHEMEKAISVVRTIVQCFKAEGTSTISRRSDVPRTGISVVQSILQQIKAEDTCTNISEKGCFVNGYLSGIYSFIVYQSRGYLHPYLGEAIFLIAVISMVETTSRCIEFDDICIDLSETRYAKGYLIGIDGATVHQAGWYVYH